jgi:hypothetical protein
VPAVAGIRRERADAGANYQRAVGSAFTLGRSDLVDRNWISGKPRTGCAGRRRAFPPDRVTIEPVNPGKQRRPAVSCKPRASRRFRLRGRPAGPVPDTSVPSTRNANASEPPCRDCGRVEGQQHVGTGDQRRRGTRPSHSGGHLGCGTGEWPVSVPIGARRLRVSHAWLDRPVRRRFRGCGTYDVARRT